MNKNQINAFERTNANKLVRDSKSGSKLNCVRFNCNNSLAHEMTKAKVCFFLQKNGLKFYTEAAFEDGSGEADVYCITQDVAWEILHSETKEHALSKKYPCEIRTIDSKNFKEADLE